MKQIQVTDFQSTNLNVDFNQVNTIEIEDEPNFEGGFGVIHLCISINGNKVSTPQIIKIFKDNSSGSADFNYITIQKLQTKLSKLNEEILIAQNKTITDEYPAFLAVPQFSFIGKVEGKTIKGFSSNNLKNLDFIDFKEILENDALLEQYQDLAIEKKLLIAYHFVNAFKVLKECAFIHADIKPEAIFINLKKNTCAIIDFDSGVVTDNIDDDTTTWGAPNEWIAPEIWKQLDANINQQKKIKVDLFTDTWSVAIGIHYFLTTCHPLFFLTELSPNVMENYFHKDKNKWPNINKNAPYFNQQYSTIYDKYIDFLNSQVPTEVKEQIASTINQGYLIPHLRTTYDRWKIVLLKIQKPPEIIFFKPDKLLTIAGLPVLLTWKVEKAHTLIIDNGIGDVTGKTEIKVKPNNNITYTLKAIGHFGEVIKPVDIAIFPTPIIESIKVPMPDFSTGINLSNFNFSIPDFDISIKIEPSNLSHIPTMFVPLNEDIKNIKPLYKKDSFLMNISNVFEKIREKLIINII